MVKKTKNSGTPPALEKAKKISGSGGDLFKERILQQAFALHQAGRPAEAKNLYQQILSTKPDHPHALYLSGLLFHQEGRSEIGAGLIG